MCDLWQATTVANTPAGAIPHQLAQAWDAIGARRSAVRQVKLYNASSFFEPRAVPECDYGPIAHQLAGLSRVIVESHPALIGPRVDRFVGALVAASSERGKSPALEVAMGLETAHPGALSQLNKKMTVDDYARAARALLDRHVDVRTFLLIGAPFVPAAEQDEWLSRSVDTAIRCGSTAISLIPTRATKLGPLAVSEVEPLAEPSLDQIEGGVSGIRRRFSGHPARIFVDLWDLRRFATCAACFDVRRDLLDAGNRRQQQPAAMHRCETCGWTSA